MSLASTGQPSIIRTERGLSIAGSRITIYDVMDFLKASYPPKLIRDKFNLADEQINAAMSYISANAAQLEAEYQEVLQTREEISQYWEEKNREHFEQIATTPRKPGTEALWTKLEKQKSQRNS
ncbi:hypothetical protein NIES4071_11740 [Calothrix sp. NIES-4071]|nr:hypothetical protein NIES4071_11740 [Calothrix sp. NIES-4071]BAZ55514.1 hypothetical protein NIES4105_11700 [Calothrix sp. NIES-4105]